MKKKFNKKGAIYGGIGAFLALVIYGLLEIPNEDAKESFIAISKSEPDPIPCRILIEQSVGQRVSCHAYRQFVGLKTPDDYLDQSTIEVYDRKNLNYLFKINRKGKRYTQEN